MCDKKCEGCSGVPIFGFLVILTIIGFLINSCMSSGVKEQETKNTPIETRCESGVTFYKNNSEKNPEWKVLIGPNGLPKGCE